MKNNYFRYLHLFLVVASLGLVIPFMGSKDEMLEPGRRPTSVPKIPRYPAPVKHKTFVKPKHRAPASFRPHSQRDFDKLVVAQLNVPLSRGNVIASNIGAIPLESWKPDMGELIWDDGVYGYIVKTPGQKTVPVAYNPMLKGFYPISSIIHVRQADQSIRDELKAAGHEEYYYFPQIRKLSLKSSPDQVIGLYQDLEKRGYKVKLEVLQHRPQAH